MKRFPVKIDLSTFFQDERKFVIILVNPAWKSVEHLQQHVEDMFDVRPVRFLTNDNLFVPPKESVKILRYADSLKAFIPKHVIEESRRRSKQLEKPENKVTTPLPVPEEPIIIKRKYTLSAGVLSSSSTPNQKKKKSRRTPIQLPNTSAGIATASSNESQEITSTNEQASLLKSPEERQPNDTDFKLSANSQQQNEKVEEMDQSARTGDIKDKTEQSVNLITIGPGVASSTLLSNSKSMDTNSHIYFDDSTLVETKNANKPAKSLTIREQKKSPKITFKCKLIEKDIDKTLIIPVKVVNKNNKTRKPLIDIKENILLPPVNIGHLISEKTKKDLNINFENNTTAKNQLSLVSDSKIDAEDTIETEANKLDCTTDETMENAEVSNDQNTLENLSEKRRNASHLEDSAIGDNVQDGKGLISHSDETTEETASAHKETENAKNSNNNDDCDLDITNEETAKSLSSRQNEDKSSINNATEDLESSSSSELDKSCVIDLDDDDDDEDVIDLSDVEERYVRDKSITNMSVAEMLPFCTALTGTPKVGDILVFKFNRKVLGGEMDISEFIACKCEHVNRRTKILKLAIIDASQEKNIIPHQYSYNLDESLNTDKFMSIKATELIEPKILET